MASPLPPIQEFHPDFLSKYDNFIFDMDGVLIHGTSFMPGVVETLNKLHGHGKRIYFCTNNSTQHRSHFYPWFSDAGISTIVPGHLYTAASTAASSVFNDVFGNRIPGPEDANSNTKILLIGQPGLHQEFTDLGLGDHIVPLQSLREEGQQQDVHAMKGFKVDPDIKAVVAGLQVDFSWSDCAIAVMIIRENQAPFYATDRDATFPASHTRQLPGCGAIINMIEGSCGKKAEAMGKPTKYMLEAIRRDHPGMDLSRTMMTGDRLDTDIAFGQNSGMATLLVFSGVVKKNDWVSDKVIIRVDGTTHVPGVEGADQDGVTGGSGDETPSSPLPLIDVHDPSAPRPTYCADNITWLFEIGGMKGCE